MFCSKCGTKIPDGSNTCPECGSPAETVVYRNKENGFEGMEKFPSAIVVIICNIILLASFFFNMYYINFFNKIEFSLSGILENTYKFFDFGNRMGAHFDISKIDLSSMSIDSILLLIAVVLVIVMYFLGVVYLIGCIEQLVRRKSFNNKKFWTDCYAVSLAVFIANLIVFILFLIINGTVSSKIGTNTEILGANWSLYLIEIMAVTSYVIARINMKHIK